MPKAESPLDRGSTDHTRDTRQRLELLFAEYVERLNSGEEIDPQEVIEKHPELAADLLRELETYESLQAVSVDSSSDQPFGTLGDYTLRRQIGRGGMGVVYDAWQGSLGRQVALKVLPPGVAADAKSSTRFLREAQIAAKLNHSQIVPVYASGIEGGTPWYAMEFIEGETLSQVIQKIKDAEPEADTVFGKKECPSYFETLGRAFAEVADGLQHAHSKGVIHRDIKPSNLILDQESRLRILDFGLARFEGQESITISGDVVGTPLYMSPEQARQRKIEVDHRTDVYSLGATMYEMIVGRPPFKGKNHQDTLSQIIERDPVEPRKLNQRIPRDLETIVLKCQRKDPRDRYGTAEALAQDLRRFLQGYAIEARPQGKWEVIAKRLRRRRRQIGLLSLFVVLLASTAILLFQNRIATRRDAHTRYTKIVETASVIVQGQAFLFNQSRGDMDLIGFGVSRVLKYICGLSFDNLGADTLSTSLTALNEAILLFPRKPEAYYWRARALVLMSREDDAVMEFRRALDVDQTFVPAQFFLRALTNSGHNADGKLEDQEHPEPWKTAWIEAYEALYERDSSRAALAFDGLTELSQGDGQFYVGAKAEIALARGYAKLLAGEYLYAAGDFSVAEYRWPESMEPSILLGKAWYLAGHKEVADRKFVDLYERGKYSSTDRVSTLVSILYNQLGDDESSLRWAQKITASPFQMAWTSFLLWDYGRCDDAAALAQKCVDMYPQYPFGFYVLGKALRGLKRYQDAKDAFERTLELQPDYVGASIDLAVVLCKLELWEEGFRRLERSIQRAPDFPYAYQMLAVAHMWQKDYEKAAEAVQRGLKVGPEVFFLRLINASLLRQTGQLHEAETELLNILSNAPQMEQAHDQIALVYMALKSAPQAVRHLIASIKLRPHRSAPYDLLLRLLARDDLTACHRQLRNLVLVLEEQHEIEKKHSQEEKITEALFRARRHLDRLGD